ncbi:hypothetical protein [Streptomonospora wellingtoniae]|uniref:Uncharacterized protein n=1 Tax=Streptomonospora wellingtoniae TaxID=3075544 RepID=A0ABU2KP44_9ACTN|nr:hypothetical protein [Streptomonospora sp. DSM 45055]MDT0301035.1 hypothetical protein [Streptomonospora sp. DSM 45055]
MGELEIIDQLTTEARKRGIALKRCRGYSVSIAGTTVTATDNLASFPTSTGATRHIAVLDHMGAAKVVDLVVADADPAAVFAHKRRART